jgi:thiol-disulfide isomerase/thioredoxin
MKRTTTLLMLSMMLNITAIAKEKVITTPYYSYTNATTINLNQVVMSDTATLLSFNVDGSDVWKIDHESYLQCEGKRYQLKWKRRYELKPTGAIPTPFEHDNWVYHNLTEQIKKPSPKDSLIFCFEPIPAKSKTFDYIGGFNHWTFDIWGIRTDGNPYPTTLKHSKNTDVLTTLPLFKPNADRAVIRGHIYGYDADKKMAIMIYSFMSLFPNEKDSHISISDNGDYTIDIKPFYPFIIHNVNFPGSYVTPVVIPGDTLTLDIDVATGIGQHIESWYWQKKSRLKGNSYAASGRFASLTEAINDYLNNTDKEQKLKQDTTETVDKYIEMCWGLYQKYSKEIAKNKKYSRMQREFMELYMQQQYVETFLHYEDYMYKSWYDALRSNAQTEEQVDKAREQAIKKTEEAARTSTLTDPHAQELTLFKDMRTAYVLHNTTYLKYMEKNGLTESPVYKWLSELKTVKELTQQIKMLNPVNDTAIWNTINPAYIPELKQLNDTALALIERKKAMMNKGTTIICNADSLHGDIIGDIVKQHTGKVVLINYWDTWCDSCLAGIRAMKPMEKELSGKDFVICYLTDASSSMEKWINQISSMPGQHYRLSENQWNNVTSLIPRYKIFDKKGKEVLDQKGWALEFLPKIRNTIYKALKE